MTYIIKINIVNFYTVVIIHRFDNAFRTRR